MISRFLRKRNKNNALPFNKNLARIQVSGASQTFKIVKTKVQQTTQNRLLTEAGNFLNTESGDRLVLE
jgi:hypothetical protein